MIGNENVYTDTISFLKLRDFFESKQFSMINPSSEINLTFECDVNRKSQNS